MIEPITMTNPDRCETIDITRYAEVMAHLRHFPADKHTEVIARLGIRRRDWDAAAAKWRKVRDSERMTGNLEVTVRFGRVMADTRANLEARQPSIESLGPYPGPDGTAVEAAAPPPPRAVLEDKPADASAHPTPAVQVPSYVAAELRAAAQAPVTTPARRSPSHLASTALGNSAPEAAVMPFSAPAGSSAEPFLRAVAHAASVQGPAGARRRPVGSETVAGPDDGVGAPLPVGVPNLTLEQYASLRVELETDPDRAAATLSRYGVAGDGRPVLDAHWKARFAADPPLRMTFARTYANYLAWRKASSASPIVHPAPAAPLPAPSPPIPQTTLGAKTPATAAAMPFLAPGASTAESYQRAVAHADAQQGPLRSRREAVGSGTLPVTDEGTVASLPPGVADLTVEQFASLRVELEAGPDRVPATLSRYGVRPDGHAALEAYWEARFSADPLLAMTFARKYADFLVWFKANPGSSRP